MDNFIEEIQEDVRRDQRKKIWDAYGNYIIGLLLVIVLVTIGYLFWKNRLEQRIYEESTQFEKALQLSADGNKKEAEKILTDLIGTADEGYKTLALLELADLKPAQGENAEELYQS